MYKIRGTKLVRINKNSCFRKEPGTFKKVEVMK